MPKFFLGSFTWFMYKGGFIDEGPHTKKGVKIWAKTKLCEVRRLNVNLCIGCYLSVKIGCRWL